MEQQRRRRPEYTQLLTPAERLECIKLGAALHFADRGISLSKLARMRKSGSVGDVVGGIADLSTAGWKGVMALSLLGGIPLGVASHVVANKLTEEKNKEIELRQKIKFFRQASGGLEEGLAGE